jgi:hypothetical protein
VAPENANDRILDNPAATIRIAEMIDALKRAACAAVFVASVTPAFAQGPSDAQRAAIRSNCRFDYIANCAGVPTGGLESLQCLHKNMSRLSGSCKTAVNAVPLPAAQR